VVIRGDDPVADSGWELHEGNIYKVALEGSTNEVYAGGQMLWMARWPNAPSLDPLEPAWSYMDVMPGNYYQTGTIYPKLHDLEIDQPVGTWTGAKIFFTGVERWWSRSGTILEHGPQQGDLQLELPPQYNDLWFGVMPAPQAPFFIYDSYAALDAPGEWFLDETNTLYLIAPDGGSPAGITVKSRDVLFDLTNRSRVRVRDLTFFSGRVRMHNATDCIVESNTFTYLSPFHFIHYPTWRDREEFVVGWNTPGTGIQTSGTATGNLIANNHISRSWGDGITLGGTNNTARGNTIHDVNYIGNKMAGIFLADHDNFIEDNTIYRTGRSGIAVHATGGHIRRNHIFDCGRINWDLGGIYMYAGFDETVGNGLEISHNLIHDIQLNNNIGPTGFQYSGSGIYLDGSTSGVDVFRNVVFNFRRYGVQLNGDSFAQRDNRNINVVNNTLLDNPLSGLNAMVGGITYQSRTNVLIANNAYTGSQGSSSGSTFSHNIKATEADFMDFDGGDFHPAQGSVLIDAGTPVPPIINGFTGLAPDVGAFEASPTP
jgi:parallel beta-helix repeat protein